MMQKQFQRIAKRMFRSKCTEDVHKTVSENCQKGATKNSVLQFSYEIETENPSNLEVLDNLDYVMSLECELQY